MKIRWNDRQGRVLTYFLKHLTATDIKWFIIRGYDGLPNNNSSKDVDIMIEVGKVSKAIRTLIESLKKTGFKYYHQVQYGHIYCFYAMNPTDEIAIHIDLIEGYIPKGYEVFTFDELWKHVVDYNGLNVLDDFMNGIMLVVYKIFGYHHAKLKSEYQIDIFKAQQNYPEEFEKILEHIAGQKIGRQLVEHISKYDFDAVVALEPKFTRALKRYTLKTRPLRTIKYVCEFLVQKVNRIIFNYRKYAKTVAVLAPDGTGKTTFLEALVDELNYYYVSDPEDNRFHIYHFRPNLLPNLGAVGEKVGIMEQDVEFTNPHRSKTANPFSSLIRISYYTLDYIFGWQKCVRNDVHYDRYTVFDRYSYDFLVDPQRTKLNLPEIVRRFFVKLTPQPGLVFCLEAKPETVYARKQELSLEEIRRQAEMYKRLAKKSKDRFVIINAEQNSEEMAKQAVEFILNKYAEKL